jgi:hypothetical protein
MVALESESGKIARRTACELVVGRGGRPRAGWVSGCEIALPVSSEEIHFFFGSFPLPAAFRTSLIATIVCSSRRVYCLGAG